jgi:hypothetical protein
MLTCWLLLGALEEIMKNNVICVRFFGALLLLLVTIAVRAKSLPETNALRAEVKISAPVDVPHGHFGSMVAARSNLLVVGFRTAPESHPDAPLAAVYLKSNGALELDGTLQLPGVTNFTVYDLATDGDRIVFAGSESGATIDDATPAIYLFSREIGEWSLQTRLQPSKTVSSVSMSGGVIVAGAPFQALVFELIGDSWVESSLRPPDDAPSAVKNGFGADVATDNGTIVVGASGDIRSDPGRAYVFVRGMNGWQLQGELLPEPFMYTPFGSAVAIDGDTVLVSAFMNRFNSGTVFVYERSADSWTRTGTLQGHNQDFFGQSLAISGRNLVVGAPSAFTGAGGVYLFRRNGETYDRVAIYREELETVNPNNGDPGAFLGKDVAVVGDTILAGAPYQDGSEQNSGVAFVFEFEFELRLEAPWARVEDSSFHFGVSGAKAGQIYVVETAVTPDGAWAVVKEFTGYIGEIQVEVDIPAGSGLSFFKVRTK